MRSIYPAIIFLIVLLNGNSFGRQYDTAKGCHADGQQNHRKVYPKEQFAEFFKIFSNDSLFQIDRIQFPLKRIYYNSDNDCFDKVMINKPDWQFFNFEKLPQYYRSEIKKENATEYRLSIYIEETDVDVQYYFKRLQGKWFLITIIDKST